MFVTAATSFNGHQHSPTKEGKNPAEISRESACGGCQAPLRGIVETPPRRLSAHSFERVTLDLGAAKTHDKPTPERIAAFHETNDPQLAALLYQYGRYLMIAGSRPGGPPLNLQGIWNDSLRPPWSSNYTININTEMNYWPAEQDESRRMSRSLCWIFCPDWRTNGRKDRHRELRRTRAGWRITIPTCGLRPRRSGMAAALLNGQIGRWAARGCVSICGSIMRSAAIRKFLHDRAYPLMKGAAEFCLGLADRGRGKGHLVTAPSTSPEHGFKTPDGQSGCGGHCNYHGHGDNPRLVHALYRGLGTAERRQSISRQKSKDRAGQNFRRPRLAKTAHCRNGTRTGLRGTCITGISRICSACIPAIEINDRDTPELFAAAKTRTGAARRQRNRLVVGLENQPVGADCATVNTLISLCETC